MKHIFQVMTVWLFCSVTSNVCAQMIGLDCESEPSKVDGYVLKYNFEIEKDSGNGKMYGKTFGGHQFSKSIHIHFSSPERMDMFSLSGDPVGHIDRHSLKFNWGGVYGLCTIVPIKKRSFPEQSSDAKF